MEPDSSNIINDIVTSFWRDIIFLPSTRFDVCEFCIRIEDYFNEIKNDSCGWNNAFISNYNS